MRCRTPAHKRPRDEPQSYAYPYRPCAVGARGVSRAGMAGPGVYRGTAVGAVWRRRMGRIVLADDAGAGGGSMLGVALAPDSRKGCRAPAVVRQAACFKAWALSTASQVNSGSARPKCP